MATALWNVLAFTGLGVGVSSAQPHKLNINGLGVQPTEVLLDAAGYQVSADATNVTLIRGSNAPASVEVRVEYPHSMIDARPLPGGVAATLLPVVIQGAGSNGGSPSGITAISGGTTFATGPAISFQNGGNITFGIAGNIVTASVQTAGGTATGVGISAGTQSQATGAVVFSNSNGVAFGMSNSSIITASYSQSVAPNAIAAAGGTITNGTASFANGNGVSFGVNGSTVTASIAAQSAFVLSNSNNVSFGTNGSTVTASASFPAQTSVSFSNANNVSFGFAGSTLTASASFPAASAFQLSNSNGMFFGTNGSTVTGRVATLSGTNGQSVQMLASGGPIIISGTNADMSISVDGVLVQSASNISLRGTNVQLLDVVGANLAIGNNIIALSAATMRFGQFPSEEIGFFGVPTGATRVSVTGSNATQVNNLINALNSYGLISAAGNITFPNAAGISAAGSSGSSGTFVFSNSNNVSFGMNGNTITASVANGGETPFGMSAGTQSISTGTVAFANSNNVTFGMSGSSQITASIPAGATATGNLGALAAGTQTATAGTINFANSNGLSFGMSNSSQITGSYSQSVAPNAIAVNGAGSITAGTAVFSNSNNITFGLNGSTITASAAAGPGAISAAGGSATNGTVVFSNSNGVSFGMNASTITASVAASSLVFSNSNNVSFGLNGSTITASASAPAQVPFGVSAGTQSVSTGTLVFSNSNNVSFGMSGSSRITASFAQSLQPGVQALAFPPLGTTFSSGTLNFINVGPLVWGGAGADSVFLSFNGAVGPALAAVGGTITSGTASLSNSNGVSFGVNGQTVTARVATVSGASGQSVQMLASGAPIIISGINADMSISIDGIFAQSASNISLRGTNVQLLDMAGAGVALGGNVFALSAATMRFGQFPSEEIGFFGVTAGASKGTITGASTNVTVVLNNLLNYLQSLGLLSKSTT